MSGYFSWTKRCRHCGYFSQSATINDNVCAECGAHGDNVWESLVAKIKLKYEGVWWNPLTWFNYKRCLVFPKKMKG